MMLHQKLLKSTVTYCENSHTCRGSCVIWVRCCVTGQVWALAHVHVNVEGEVLYDPVSVYSTMICIVCEFESQYCLHNLEVLGSSAAFSALGVKWVVLGPNKPKLKKKDVKKEESSEDELQPRWWAKNSSSKTGLTKNASWYKAWFLTLVLVKKCLEGSIFVPVLTNWKNTFSLVEANIMSVYKALSVTCKPSA